VTDFCGAAIRTVPVIGDYLSFFVTSEIMAISLFPLVKFYTKKIWGQC
jgi:formate hydrogenlyase subunit 3/multisubunit Na+/H+ antiporter MnhD subunit